MTDDTSPTDRQDSTTDRHVTDDAAETGTEVSAPTPAPVLAGLAEHATPLSTTDPGAPLDDLDPLRDRFGSARVVGLGEASHGTREFFRLKRRLLRYLVTEFDVLAADDDERTADWLAASRSRFSVGNSYDPESRAAFRTERAPAEAFDLLCHLPETERARPTASGDG